jgi:hypothetical protein
MVLLPTSGRYPIVLEQFQQLLGGHRQLGVDAGFPRGEGQDPSVDPLAFFS